MAVAGLWGEKDHAEKILDFAQGCLTGTHIRLLCSCMH